MAPPTKPSRPATWLTKQEMADVLDVTVAYFDREVRRHANREHVRQEGRRLLFYARGVLDAWYARKNTTPIYDTLPLDLELMLAGIDPLHNT